MKFQKMEDCLQVNDPCSYGKQFKQIGTRSSQQTSSLNTLYFKKQRNFFLNLFCLVDKKEIHQLHLNFIKECPNGRLSKSDLLLIYRQFFPFGDPEPFVSRLVEMFSDGSTRNGSISFEDYIHGMSVISRGRVDEKMQCKLNESCFTFTLQHSRGIQIL